MKAKKLKSELLAPAGSLEKLQTALAFGADAVYFGIPDFSLRYRINTFTPTKIKQGIKYAHAQGKKVYITFNIYAHQRHLKKLERAVKFVKEIKPDAIIVSDPGILSLLKKKFPKMELHLSTQANCTNSAAAKFWYEQGISRIILGREVTLAEIKEIHRQVPKVELEAFVHGAMCMSYSGRCILSKWLTGRSANLGDCSQPCRWQYQLTETNSQERSMLIEEDANGTYFMNSKDMCLIKNLDELAKAGICSFKIEGRNKSIFYLATVVKAYREAIDKTNPVSALLKELNTLANRGYSTGFLWGKDKWENNFNASHVKQAYQLVGEVVRYNKEEKTAEIKVHNSLHLDDKVDFIVPGGKNFNQKINYLFDTRIKTEVSEMHGGQGQTAIIKVKNETPIFTVIRKKIN